MLQEAISYSLVSPVSGIFLAEQYRLALLARCGKRVFRKNFQRRPFMQGEIVSVELLGRFIERRLLCTASGTITCPLAYTECMNFHINAPRICELAVNSRWRVQYFRLTRYETALVVCQLHCVHTIPEGCQVIINLVHILM